MDFSIFVDNVLTMTIGWHWVQKGGAMKMCCPFSKNQSVLKVVRTHSMEALVSYVSPLCEMTILIAKHG